MTLKSYSFSNGFQDLVLGSMLLDPVFLVECREALRASYFIKDSHQIIAGVLLDYFDRFRGKPGKEVVCESLRQRAVKSAWPKEDETRILEELTRLYESPTEEHQSAVVRQMAVQFGRHQAVKEAILRSVELVDAADRDPDRADLSPVVSLLQSALGVGQSKHLGVNLFEHLGDISTVSEGPAADPRSRVATGFRRLDSYLDGGLGGGELGFVLGQSGRGKSMMLINLAASAIMQGKSVVYFTLELRPYDVVSRVLARMTRCTIKQVQTNDAAYTRLVPSLERMPGAKTFQVVHFPPSRATSIMLRSTLARLDSLRGVRPGLLVVDYLDEMRSSSSQPRDDENIYHVYGTITSELIDLGNTYGCPVWTASQVTRDGYGNDDPNMSKISRSIQKVEKADVVLALCQTDDELEKQAMRLKVLKMRRGHRDNQYVRLNVDFSRAMLSEVVTKEDQSCAG